ncbi:MAG: hypothetical protein IPM24_01975 [Bryobacterales bacterium]|nr:hypothetical protein [Bryobacterales bacterium]
MIAIWLFLCSLSPLAALYRPDESCKMQCSRAARCCCTKTPPAPAGVQVEPSPECGDTCRGVPGVVPAISALAPAELASAAALPVHADILAGRGACASIATFDFPAFPRPPPIA